MPYTSPFRILGVPETNELDEKDLHRLREKWQEKVDKARTEGKFPLQETTPFSSEEIKKALESLTSDPAFHKRIFNNKTLLSLLEEGDPGLLDQLPNQDEWRDPIFRNQFLPMLTTRLHEVVLRSVKEKGYLSMKKLRALRESGFQVSNDQKEEIYAGALSFFRNFVNEGLKQSRDPFETGSTKKLKKDMQEYLEAHYVNALKVLPDDMFRPILADYSKMAHQVLDRAFQKSKKTGRFERDTLWFLRNAADICLLEAPEDKSMQKLRSDLEERMYEKSGQSGSKIGDIVILLLILAFLVFRFHACASRL